MALRPYRVTAVISHECEGRLGVVFTFLCETIAVFEFIRGQEQRVGEASVNVTDRPRRGICHMLLMAVWAAAGRSGNKFPLSFCICVFPL